MKGIRTGLVALSLAAACVSNAGDTLRAIYTNIQSSGTSVVPGLSGVRFKTGTSTQFDRAWCSADGRRWVLRANANLATTNDGLILSGTGVNGAGATLVAQEGSATGYNPLLTYTTIKRQMGINNAGMIAFSADTSDATTADDHVVRFNGTSQELFAVEGTVMPGGGDSFGSTNDSVHILEDGSVGFRSAFLANSTGDDALVMMSSPTSLTLVARTNSTMLGNQLAAPQLVDVFNAEGYRTSPNGTLSILAADLVGPTTSDILTAVNLNVVGQEGAVLPGSTFTSLVTSLDTAGGTRQIANNSYAYRGSNADTIDFVAANGSVVASTDSLVFSTGTELWDDTSFAACYFLNTTNERGEVVVGGVTNNIAANNGLCVFLEAIGGQYYGCEVAREGDPVDIDGNGVYDDNAFLSVFNNDDSFLTKDGRYYFIADIVDGVGASIGQGFFVKQVGAPLVAYSVVEGIGFGGDLASLCKSDNNKLFILSDESVPNATVEITHNVGQATLAGIRISVEVSSNRSDLSMFVEAKNQTTSLYQNIGFAVPTLNDDIKYFYFMSPQANSLINVANGHLESRIRFVPQSDLEAADGWLEAIDMVNVIGLR